MTLNPHRPELREPRCPSQATTEGRRSSWGWFFGSIVSIVILFGTTAMAGTGIGSVFNLGRTNPVNAKTTLSGSHAGSQLQVINSSAGKGANGIGMEISEGQVSADGELDDQGQQPERRLRRRTACLGFSTAAQLSYVLRRRGHEWIHKAGHIYVHLHDGSSHRREPSGR